jgi:hypothetical protein
MSKVEELRNSLRPFLGEVLSGGDTRVLVHFLIVNSNLPGPHPNFELAQALADEIVAYVSEKGTVVWGVVANWADVDAQEAPTGNPREYLPLCASIGLGALGAASDMWRISAFDRLRYLARDTRELVREGVVLGLRRMLKADFLPAADELVVWIEGGNPYEMSAVAQAVGEPLLLTEKENASAALALHRALIDTYVLMPVTWRDQPELRALRETLCSSLSVAVAASPDQGFRDIRRWAAKNDPDLNWVLMQNLTQPRLINVYQVETELLLKQIRPKP